MIKLNSKNYSIVIDENKGALTEFTTHGKNVCVKEGSPLFSVAMRDKLELNTFYSTDFTFIDSSEKDGKIALNYALDSQKLKATAFIDNSNGFELTLSVENNSKLLIDYVDLLLLTVNGKLKAEGGEGEVLYPFNEGAIYDDLDFRVHSDLDYIPPQCPSRLGGGVYPNMVESQFLAYLLDGYGIYLGMHDKTFAPKGIDFYPSTNGMAFELRYYPGLNYGESLTLSCPAVIKAFDGDWMNAADIYKEWYEQNKPDGLVKLIDRKLPEWFKKSPTVIAYHVTTSVDGITNPNKLFPYVNAMKHIDKLAEQTGGPILALLMRWEGTAPWNAPYVWPPIGGEQPFKEYVDALHASGNFIGVYCSGLGFTEQHHLRKSYNQRDLLQKPEILNSLCIQPDGELAPSQNVTFVRQGYDLCIKGEKTKEIMCKEVQSIVDANVDYIQILDQNHGGNACFCYSDKHGHPVGQGAWQVDAVRDMLDDLVKIGGDEVVFGCESSSADPFLKVLYFNDVRYQNLYIAGAHPVPLNNYLYHEYMNNFMGNGSWSGLRIGNDFLFYRAAFSFAQGDMLTYIINEDGNLKYNCELTQPDEQLKRTELMAMTKQMNEWRRARNEYLVYGVSQKPKKLDFGGLVNKVPHSRADRFESLPKLTTGAFLAEDGSVAQFVVNYNSEPIEFKLADGESMSVYANPEDKGANYNSYTIAPYSVVMIK